MAKKPSVPHFRYERLLAKESVWPVAGMDEVGRGPLAGPVAAAAVVLDPKRLPKGVNDSKALTAEERVAAYDEIMRHALAVSVAFASAAEIDVINIRQASLTAMRRALAALALAPRYVLVDGNDLPPALRCTGETIVGGDARSLSIAAASIVAKVTRDRLMIAALQALSGLRLQPPRRLCHARASRRHRRARAMPLSSHELLAVQTG